MTRLRLQVSLPWIFLLLLLLVKDSSAWIVTKQGPPVVHTGSSISSSSSSSSSRRRHRQYFGPLPPRFHSQHYLETGGDHDAAIFQGEIFAGGISREEVSALAELIESIPIFTDSSFVRVVDSNTANNDDTDWMELSLHKLPPGATGRVAIVELILPAPTQEEEEDCDEFDAMEEWKALICQQIDDILYSGDDNRAFRQPILLSVVNSSITANTNANDTSVTTSTSNVPKHNTTQDQRLLALIAEQMLDYGLAESMEKSHEIVEVPGTDFTTFMPSLRYEVDGAMVVDGDIDDTTLKKVWDTSSVLVFDNLLPPEMNLRERIIDVVLGRVENSQENSKDSWDDAANGPDPARWIAGVLTDLPISNDASDDAKDTKTSEVGIVPKSYGLSDDALQEIYEDGPPPQAFQEFESILADLFPDFTVTRLPEAVLGAGVTPVTANAPCFGQAFDYHIDADPYFAPPSPWTDVYGRYANRASGKPRFMSCLIYLNHEWDNAKWGAPTRFLDVATGTEVDVSPMPGRVVLMDQDITHTVVAPSEAAGKRPRYSLVWKLILHPKMHNQDMRDLCGASHTGWPDPVLVGSADR